MVGYGLCVEQKQLNNHIKTISMNKNLFGGGRIYTSPKVDILEFSSEKVLCQSGIDEITLNTGANWYVGDDAEW